MWAKLGARAGLLANSGCFVSSKCVLWCFVVFCGCFVMFCGCFTVFCECFAVFPQNTQNTRKTSKNTGKHEELTIRSCIAGVFQEPKISTVRVKGFRGLTPKPKTRFVKIRRKTPQNKRKTLKTVTKRSQYSRNSYWYCARSVYSSKIRWICRESTQYAIYA